MTSCIAKTIILLHIKLSADTVGGVMLGDISEVFTHPFAQCSFGLTNIAFIAHLTGNTVDDVIRIATTAPE